MHQDLHNYKLGHCILLYGNWKAGWALDWHTISSKRLQDGTFDTEYTKLGYDLNQLKYHGQHDCLQFLAESMVAFLETRLVLPYIDVLIPTPSSKERSFQPVYELTNMIGGKLKKQVRSDLIKKVKQTEELKNIQDPLARKQALSNAFQVLEPDFV